jgi:sterol 3beta-glucosyltransferase
MHEVDGRIDFDVTRLSRMISGISQHELQDPDKAVHEHFSKKPSVRSADVENSCPRLNIVLQVVGSRGDVQPFVALALELQSSGHRVRLATHPVFKQFVENLGLEFFDISGDPAELMAYMVRNPGVIPKMSSMRGNAIEMQKKAISRILSGCWKSCIRTCDCVDEVKNKSCQKPSCLGKPLFIADLIIANPPSFAHIHCAEKLGIPLHIVFT